MFDDFDTQVNVEEIYVEGREFLTPTQLKFWDVDAGDDGHYIGGIGIGHTIVCGCCGGTFEVQEIMDAAPEGIEPIIVYENWVPIDEAICGDE